MSDENNNAETETNAVEEPVEVGNPITNALHRAEQGITAALHAVEEEAVHLGETFIYAVSGDDEQQDEGLQMLTEFGRQITEAVEKEQQASEDRDATIKRIEAKIDHLIGIVQVPAVPAIGTDTNT